MLNWNVFFYRLLGWVGLLWLGQNPASAALLQTLTGHVPEVVRTLTPTGRLPAGRELHLAIGVPLKDPTGLESLIAEVSDPASANYRRYLTPDDFAARFSATESDYAAVCDFAWTNGFQITRTHGNRMLVEVTARVADVERAFHLRLNQYQHPTEARTFFAPDADPTVAAGLAVADIQGLSDYARPHPHFVKSDVLKVTPQSGTAPDGWGSYFGDDFRNAYVPGTALTGAGQSVGLLQFDGFYSNDIAAYAAAAGGGRSNIVIQTVLVQNYNGTPSTNGGNLEVSLDIEMAMAMAPGLDRIVLFEISPTNVIPNALLAAMVTNTAIKQFSCSWAWSGGPQTTTDTYFKQMIAQGQSFFDASGDSDAFTVGRTTSNGVDNTSKAHAPASSPYITVVGGTTLAMGGAGINYASENVWNWNNGSGSSGGVSSYYSLPSWQSGISMTANHGSTTKRNIPDVALTADNVYVISDGTATGHDGIGGTSCAAPLWAGFMALVNQQAASLGHPAAGFINPTIYAIGKGQNSKFSYMTCFHDTTNGNNYWTGSTANYPGVTNYDLCTGWGTPNGTNLINALTSDTLSITPAGDLTASGIYGGPFGGAVQNYALTNIVSTNLAWSLVNTSAWLSVSPASGTLAGGKGTNLALGFTGAANALAAGSYATVLLFTNQTTGLTQTRMFVLQVLPDLAVSPANGFTANGQPGGPFDVTTQDYSLTNVSTNAYSWGIVNTSAWLNVSVTSGTLAAGAVATTTLSLSGAAYALPAGSYWATVLVTNQGNVSDTLIFDLEIGQSIVDNGGFETGDFTGWTLAGTPNSGGMIYNAVVTTNTVSGNAGGSFIHSGIYGAFLGDIVLATLSQDLVTIPGQNYLLSFWLANPVSGPGQQFLVNWNTNAFVINQIYYTNNPPVLPWTYYSFIVTATEASTTLAFGAQNMPDGFGLDDVSVVPVNLGLGITYLNLQLGDVTLPAGSNAVFSTDVVGAASLFFQWQKNGTNLVDGGNISGSTNNTLTLANIADADTGLYRVIISGTNGSLTTSNAVLTVIDPPVIQAQPVGATLLAGSNFVCSATAGGSPTLVYQWLKDSGALINGSGVSGANSNVLSLSAVTTNQSGNYSLWVTNAAGSVTSSVATLTVVVPASFTGTLTNRTAECGANTNLFSITVSGTAPVEIQWKLDGSAIPGATNTSLGLTNLTLPSHVVGVTVSNLYGSASSNATVMLQDTVMPALILNGTNVMTLELRSPFVDPGATASDTCMGPVTVTVSGTVNTNAVSTNTLTYKAGDGNGNTNSLTRTVIVRDTTPPSITWSFTNLVLAANTNCVALMPDVTGTNFIQATDLSGTVAVTQSPTNNAVLALGTNRVVQTVKDASGNAASATNQIVVRDQTPPVIWTPPQSQTNLVSSNATFTVFATACTALGWQWYSNSAALPAQTNSALTLSNLTLAAAGNYFVVVSAAGGSVTSSVAQLTVHLLPSALVLSSTANPAGYKDSLSFTASLSPTSATGTVQFLTNGTLFDTEALTTGVAVSTNVNTLQRGTNWITAIYLGDARCRPATNWLAQGVTNHPPATQTAWFPLTAGLNLTIPVAALATNWSDADGDVLSLVSIAPSTNGVVISNASPALFYSNSNYVDDRFLCAVSDGLGGTNFQAVQIVIVPQTNATPTISTIAAPAPGQVQLRLGGAFGSTYVLECKTNFLQGTWTPVATNTLGLAGLWQFSDFGVAQVPSRFYRLRLLP